MYLSKDRMMDSISEQLINLSKFVLVKNQMGRTDINVGSEDFFCQLINITHGFRLHNMNQLQSNYPAIDLADENARVCFQVTSENTKRKIESTIEKFKENELNEKYDWLIFLVISDKNKPQVSNSEEFGVDVLDINDLIGQIGRIQDINILDRISKYLSQNLRSSAPVNNSILPTNINSVSGTFGYEEFISMFDLNSNDEYDNEYKRLLIDALNNLHRIIATLSQQEREYLYFVVAYGSSSEQGSGFYTETLLIPTSKLDAHLSQHTALEMYKSLSINKLVSYIDDYQPDADSPYIPSIELSYWGECETNLFLSIKNFANNDTMLRSIIINNDFSLLC